MGKKSLFEFLSNSGWRKVIIIGRSRKTIKLSAETIRKYNSVKEFLLRGKELLKADLAVIYSGSSERHFIYSVANAVHDAGYLMVFDKDAALHSRLVRAGFESKNSLLYKKREKKSPKDYGKNYLNHFGDIDFLRFWELSGQQILQHLPSGKNIKSVNFLDVGCLNCYTMEILRLHGARNIYGTDLSYNLAIKNCLNPYHLGAVLIADFCFNTYPDKYFDMTIAFEVIEHIDPMKTELFINELKRVTKDDGVILLSSSEDPTADDTHINCRKKDQWYREFFKSGLVPSGKQEIYPGFNSFVLKKDNVNKIYWVFYLSLQELKRHLEYHPLLKNFRKILYYLQLVLLFLNKYLHALLHADYCTSLVNYPEKRRHQMMNAELRRKYHGQRTLYFHKKKISAILRSSLGNIDILFWDLPSEDLNHTISTAKYLLKKGGFLVTIIEVKDVTISEWVKVLKKNRLKPLVLEPYWSQFGITAGYLWFIRKSLINKLSYTFPGKIISWIIHATVFAFPIVFLTEIERIAPRIGTEKMVFIKARKQ